MVLLGILMRAILPCRAAKTRNAAGSVDHGSALGVAEQALPAALLPRRELVAPALVGVLAGLQDEANRCPREIERLAEAVDEVAAIGVGQVLRLLAVDDDHGRIAAALVGIAQADAPAPHQRRDRKSVV